MRTVLVSLFFLIALPAWAQRNCGHTDYVEQQMRLDPSLAGRVQTIEDFLHQHRFSTNRTENTGGEEKVLRIPVVVHIVYNKASQNLTDAQVKSQIDALNRDFRRLNADTVQTPARFSQLAADIKLEFALATADPRGRSTTGIVRKQTHVNEWRLDDKIKFTSEGGSDAWDTRFYLNIWVGYMRSTLGYASTPGSDAAKDGVVISPEVFGTLHVNTPFHLGRTATHEVGHWLGLKHIWGDTYCGDDFVDDTPQQGSYTTGCPTGFRTSCNNGSQGDMYMNYMDYTHDGCMNLFTQGQKQRMRTLFEAGGPRHTLLQSKGLYEPWLEEAPIEILPNAGPEITAFPNPARSSATVTVSSDRVGKQLFVFDAAGTMVQVRTIPAKQFELDLGTLKAGMYFIQAQGAGQPARLKLLKL